MFSIFKKDPDQELRKALQGVVDQFVQLDDEITANKEEGGKAIKTMHDLHRPVGGFWDRPDAERAYIRAELHAGFCRDQVKEKLPKFTALQDLLTTLGTNGMVTELPVAGKRSSYSVAYNAPKNTEEVTALRSKLESISEKIRECLSKEDVTSGGFFESRTEGHLKSLLKNVEAKAAQLDRLPGEGARKADAVEPQDISMAQLGDRKSPGPRP